MTPLWHGHYSSALISNNYDKIPAIQHCNMILHLTVELRSFTRAQGQGQIAVQPRSAKLHKTKQTRKGSCLCTVEWVQPRSCAGASDERRPIEHGEAGRPRARLGLVQRASGEQMGVRAVDHRHGRIVLRGEPADVRGVFDAAVDGEARGAVELVVKHLVAVCDPPAMPPNNAKRAMKGSGKILFSAALWKRKGFFFVLTWERGSILR
jgi:hypothetical protein